MKVTYEQRPGRLTATEWRVVVEVGGQTAAGPWCFTKRDARTHADEVRRSLFDAERAERTVEAESARRMARIRTRLEVDRRIRTGTDG